MSYNTIEPSHVFVFLLQELSLSYLSIFYNFKVFDFGVWCDLDISL